MCYVIVLGFVLFFTSEEVQVFYQLRCWVYLMQPNTHFSHFLGQRGQTSLESRRFNSFIKVVPDNILQIQKMCQINDDLIKTQRRKTGKKWDLQISALPRQTAFKCVEKLEVGVFCWVWIQSVRVRVQVAGVAFGLYQCRETRTIQSLFKLLEKLEQSPENKWEMKVEREISWQQDMNHNKWKHKAIISPVGLLHRLFNRPETDIIPFWDLDKILRTVEIREAVQKACKQQTDRSSMWCGGILI